MPPLLRFSILICGITLLSTFVVSCSDSPAERSLTVFAAASLNEVFVDIADDFEAAHEGVEVKFSFAGSSDLVSQLEAGAPAEVFASANETQMQRAIELDVVRGGSILFASNTLALVTPSENPAGITSLEDAAGASLVVCAAQVPCGSATEEMAGAAGIELKPVSEENSVTDVLGKITSGQADAGIVYVTDAIRAGDDVTVIAIPEAASVVNQYPIAAVNAEDRLAQDFVDLVMSPASQERLRLAGFGSPS